MNIDINKDKAIQKRELKKYLWYNVMLYDHLPRERERKCPYCGEWIKSKDVLAHFWAEHKDIYIKYKIKLFNK